MRPAAAGKPRLTEAHFSAAAQALGCEVAAVKAVCQVEAPRGGFNPDGTPATLFEGNKFYQYTAGKFPVPAPDLCFPKWTGSSTARPGRPSRPGCNAPSRSTATRR